MRRVLVVADTELPPRRHWLRYARAADTIVAADGGADRARSARLRVDWLVGDLDGVSASARGALAPERVVRSDDAYSTDLEKTLRFVAERGARDVTIVAAIGGRLDHTLGTLAVLAEWGRRLVVRVIDAHFTTTLVQGTASFRAPRGTMVSLFSPGGAARVTTRGLRYELADADLPFSSLGVHNEVAKSPVSVRVGAGTLLLLRAHYVKRHG